MRKQYKLPTWIKINIENELRHFYDNSDKLKEIREEILDGSPPPPDGQPKGNAAGNPTESKVIKMNTKYILTLERKLKNIENAKKLLNEEENQLFDIMYKDGLNARLARTYKCISEDSFYSAKRKIQYLTAIELGYI